MNTIATRYHLPWNKGICIDAELDLACCYKPELLPLGYDLPTSRGTEE